MAIIAKLGQRSNAAERKVIKNHGGLRMVSIWSQFGLRAKLVGGHYLGKSCGDWPAREDSNL